MAEHTTIEWTEATWNVITGCSVISPGCTNCYAMRLAGTRLKHHPTREGLTVDSKAGPVWNGSVRFNREWLHQPLEWKRPRRIFVCAHGDLFHPGVWDAWLDEIFAIMALAPHHTYQVLTKRSAEMRAYLNDPTTQARIAVQMMELAPVGQKLANPPVLTPGRPMSISRWPLPNVWLGVSAEDQTRANERIPDLLETPAAVRWVSAEPLIGPLDLSRISTMRFRGAEVLNALTGELSGMFGDPCPTRLPRLDWVVPGGESGPDARPMHPDWPRLLRDQCVEAGVPFLFKQHGAWAVTHDRDRDYPDWRDSADVSRWPNSRWLNLAGGHGFNGERVVRVQKVGKKAAGRELDGRTWDELPKVAA